MERSEFMISLGLGITVIAVPSCMNKKSAFKIPNILFIMTDDHASQALSCCGSKINMNVRYYISSIGD
ncbi:MAG: hypothetical protein U9Q97_08010 [Acidobacteriota bacterium]|nr:hypothetical protein [Acidobacteriota bacterium]